MNNRGLDGCTHTHAAMARKYLRNNSTGCSSQAQAAKAANNIRKAFFGMCAHLFGRYVNVWNVIVLAQHWNVCDNVYRRYVARKYHQPAQQGDNISLCGIQCV